MNHRRFFAIVAALSIVVISVRYYYSCQGLDHDADLRCMSDIATHSDNLIYGASRGVRPANGASIVDFYINMCRNGAISFEEASRLISKKDSWGRPYELFSNGTKVVIFSKGSGGNYGPAESRCNITHEYVGGDVVVIKSR